MVSIKYCTFPTAPLPDGFIWAFVAHVFTNPSSSTMSGLEVTGVVSSIISAFDSCMELFKRMRAKRKRQRQKSAKLTEEEQDLHSSLQRGPREIRAEYDRGVTRLGHRFEVGDPMAHSRLARTLFVLNTGLLNIIAHALSDDPKACRMSRSSLLGLSEAAKTDTIGVLDQLSKRLTSSSNITIQPQLPSTHKRQRRAKEDHQHGSESKQAIIPFLQKQKKRPGPNPIVRGAWVRSKSGSSIVASNVGNSRQGKHKKNHSATSLPKMTKLAPRNSTEVDQNPPCDYHSKDSASNVGGLSNEDPLVQRLQGRPSEPEMWVSSPEAFDSGFAPPQLPRIPIERPVPSQKPRPPSVATFRTASTKVGEIPENRWGDRLPLPWDQRPMPYVLPPPIDPDLGKRKTRGFKLWWKKYGKGDKAGNTVSEG